MVFSYNSHDFIFNAVPCILEEVAISLTSSILFIIDRICRTDVWSITVFYCFIESSDSLWGTAGDCLEMQPLAIVWLWSLVENQVVETSNYEPLAILVFVILFMIMNCMLLWGLEIPLEIPLVIIMVMREDGVFLRDPPFVLHLRCVSRIIVSCLTLLELFLSFLLHQYFIYDTIINDE